MYFILFDPLYLAKTNSPFHQSCYYASTGTSTPANTFIQGQTRRRCAATFLQQQDFSIGTDKWLEKQCLYQHVICSIQAKDSRMQIKLFLPA